MAEPIHLQPTAPLSPRVLLPGDPARALLLAQSLLSDPKMFNHNRGLWGYTGTAADGEPLTIQSTGMGGPSAAIVISELVELGARQLIRVGTCGALDPALALGDLLAVTAARPRDGTSRALGAPDPVHGDRLLTEALLAGGSQPAVVISTDLFYEDPDTHADEDAAAVEMETATLFALAGRDGFAAASLLAVSDLVLPQRSRIDPDAMRVAELALGNVALTALSPRR